MFCNNIEKVFESISFFVTIDSKLPPINFKSISISEIWLVRFHFVHSMHNFRRKDAVVFSVLNCCFIANMLKRCVQSANESQANQIKSKFHMYSCPSCEFYFRFIYSTIELFPCVPVFSFFFFGWFLRSLNNSNAILWYHFLGRRKNATPCEMHEKRCSHLHKVLFPYDLFCFAVTRVSLSATTAVMLSQPFIFPAKFFIFVALAILFHAHFVCAFILFLSPI